MISLDVNFDIKCIDMKQLTTFFDPVTVREYCSHCSNYGKNYSCPSIEEKVGLPREDYRFGTVIMTSIDSSELKKHWQEVSKGNYDCQVTENYVKDNQVDVDIYSRLSMYLFNEVKDNMETILLDAEDEFHSVSSPPGSCTRCTLCMKKMSTPCVYPDKIRFSLEALGYMVGDIYTELFQTNLGWTKGSLQKQYRTCSCLFSDEKIDVDQLKAYLEGKLTGVEL